ncbi:hypothetical protein [Haemophilus parahaemolyticus]|uniref:hypothetical protein n=1 Tax=Haemophilus parahaemolyticus TaxID=735 RepID=UPI0028E75A9B|nr:hypothetical protein [Haemophilus parahaemolyticus]
MAMSRAEINAKSDAKRGIKAKTFKLHESTIAQIEQLSIRLDIPQNQLIKLAIERLTEQVDFTSR